MFYHIISTESSKLLKIENIGFSSDPVNNKYGPEKRDLYLMKMEMWKSVKKE